MKIEEKMCKKKFFKKKKIKTYSLPLMDLSSRFVYYYNNTIRSVHTKYIFVHSGVSLYYYKLLYININNLL